MKTILSRRPHTRPCPSTMARLKKEQAALRRTIAGEIADGLLRSAAAAPVLYPHLFRDGI